MTMRASLLALEERALEWWKADTAYRAALTADDRKRLPSADTSSSVAAAAASSSGGGSAANSHAVEALVERVASAAGNEETAAEIRSSGSRIRRNIAIIVAALAEVSCVSQYNDCYWFYYVYPLDVCCR